MNGCLAPSELDDRASRMERSPNCGHVTCVPATRELFSGPGFWAKLSGMKAESMKTESKSGKDNLKVEKLSLLVLTLCIVVLVYLLVARPF